MKNHSKKILSLALVLILLFSLCSSVFAYQQVGNGSQGNDVKTMQKMLNTVMNAGLTVDGICGAKSVAAIKNFQKAYGLTADGICGKNTWAKLEAEYNKKINPTPAKCTSHTKGSYLWFESSHPHYNYYKCANCGAQFTDGSTTKVNSCTTCNPPKPSTPSYKTVQSGSQGSDVKTMQTMLNAVMNAGLTVDGICGAKSVDAIKKFQKACGLSADGICGKQTWEKLKGMYDRGEKIPAKCTSHKKGSFSHTETAHPHKQYYKCANCGTTFADGSTKEVDSCTTCNPPATSSYKTVQNGSQGDHVKTMQTMLNAVMNAGLTVDGICGAKSVDAIKKFQKACGLSADGICGKQTWEKLKGMYDRGEKIPAKCTSHKKGAFSHADSAHPHKQYYKCANCGTTFTDGSTTKVNSCTTCNPKPSTPSYKTVQNGSQGDHVKEMQTMLNAVMNAGLTVDGICGAKSVDAIKKFQEKHKLSADGVCGAKTWELLEAKYKEIEDKKKNCKKHKYNSENGDRCINCGFVFQPKFKAVNKVYYTVKDNVVLRDNYYASGKIKRTIKEEGSPIQITHSFTNAVNNTWYKTSEGYYVYSERVTEKSNKCSIIYDANGGKNAPTAQAMSKNKTIKLSTQVPTRYGYEFVGWNENKSATAAAYSPGSSLKLSKDVKLYAIWKCTDNYVSYAERVAKVKLLIGTTNVCQEQLNRIKYIDGAYTKTTGICNISSIVTLLNRKLFADNKGHQKMFSVRDALSANGCDITYGPTTNYINNAYGYEGYAYTGNTDAWACSLEYTNADNTTYTVRQLSKSTIDQQKGNRTYDEYVTELLRKHPEGICLRNTKANHVFVITHYEISGDKIQYYVQDPAGKYTGPLEGSYLYKQAGYDIFKNLNFIAYID